MKGVSDKKHSTHLSFESKNIINPLCTMFLDVKRHLFLYF